MKNDIDINLQLRSEVLEISLNLEDAVNELLLALLLIEIPRRKAISNKSGNLSFKNKIDLLFDLEVLLTLTLHKNINFALHFGYAAFCRTSRKWDRSSRTVWLALMVRVSSPFGLMRRPAL